MMERKHSAEYRKFTSLVGRLAGGHLRDVVLIPLPAP